MESHGGHHSIPWGLVLAFPGRADLLPDPDHVVPPATAAAHPRRHLGARPAVIPPLTSPPDSFQQKGCDPARVLDLPFPSEFQLPEPCSQHRKRILSSFVNRPYLLEERNMDEHRNRTPARMCWHCWPGLGSPNGTQAFWCCWERRTTRCRRAGGLLTRACGANPGQRHGNAARGHPQPAGKGAVRDQVRRAADSREIRARGQDGADMVQDEHRPPHRRQERPERPHLRLQTRH